MYIQKINNGKRVPMYHCGNYPKVPVGTLRRSEHRIKAEYVMEIVAKTIKKVIQYANLDKEHFVEEIQSIMQEDGIVNFANFNFIKINIVHSRLVELSYYTKVH